MCFKAIPLPNIYDQENTWWPIHANVYNVGNKLIRCYTCTHQGNKEDRGSIDSYDKITGKLDFISSIGVSERRPRQIDPRPLKLVQTIPLENDRFCTISDVTFTVLEANTLTPIFVRSNLDNQHNIMFIGNRVAYCTYEDQVEIWDIAEQKCLYLIELHVHPRLIKKLIFNEHMVVVLYESTPIATGMALFFFNSPTMVGNTQVFDHPNIDLGKCDLEFLVGSTAFVKVDIGRVNCMELRLYNLETRTCLYSNVRMTEIKWTHDNQFLYCNEDDDRMIIIKVDLQTGQVSHLSSTNMTAIFHILQGHDRVIALAGMNLPCSMYIWNKNGELITHCMDLFPFLKINYRVNVEGPTFQQTVIKNNILYLEYWAGDGGERRLQFWNLADGKRLLDKELVEHMGTTVVNEVVLQQSVRQVISYNYESFIPKISNMQKISFFGLSWFKWFAKYYRETIFPSRSIDLNN